MVKASAKKDFDGALMLAREYLEAVRQERANTEEAIKIVQQILSGGTQDSTHYFKRKEVSEVLDISMDTLRNWEITAL